MTLRLIIIFIISLPTLLVGQNTFELNSKVGDSLKLEINGEYFYLHEESINISTNYPQFDTIVFLSEGANSNDKIICNFKPDSSYSIASACCTSLDIIPTSKLENDSLKAWYEDYEVNFSKIQKALLDRPNISLKLGSKSVDTIFGWYVDMACFPQFKKLSTKKWDYGTPEKCFYWNNISPFIFFRSSVLYESNEKGIIEDIYPEFEKIEILGEIQVRLFDDDRFILTFDPETKKAKLEYE